LERFQITTSQKKTFFSVVRLRADADEAGQPIASAAAADTANWCGGWCTYSITFCHLLVEVADVALC
jgi:hypothetical protein